jgi:hypothetical protein
MTFSYKRITTLIETLKRQREATLGDIETLKKLKIEANERPIDFVENLVNKVSRQCKQIQTASQKIPKLPSTKFIPSLPQISWGSYLMKDQPLSENSNLQSPKSETMTNGMELSSEANSNEIGKTTPYKKKKEALRKQEVIETKADDGSLKVIVRGRFFSKECSSQHATGSRQTRNQRHSINCGLQRSRRGWRNCCKFILTRRFDRDDGKKSQRSLETGLQCRILRLTSY